MAFELPELPYAYDALGDFMSAETLEYHHDKHHLAYVTNGNNLLKDSGLEGKSLEDVIKGSFGSNAGLFNNAAQHYNHVHFWKWMKPLPRLVVFLALWLPKLTKILVAWTNSAPTSSMLA